jgi:hypothetical protein
MMIFYLTDKGQKVDPNGQPIEQTEKPSGPFADLSPAVQKSLADEGITTVAEAQAKGKEGLVALDGIGEATADKIMALKAE